MTTMMVSAYNPLNSGMYYFDLAGLQMQRSLVYRTHVRPNRTPLFVFDNLRKPRI